MKRAKLFDSCMRFASAFLLAQMVMISPGMVQATASAQDAIPGPPAAEVTASQDGLTLGLKAAWDDATHADGDYDADETMTVSGVAAADSSSIVSLSQVLTADWTVDRTALESELSADRSVLAAQGIVVDYDLEPVVYGEDGAPVVVAEGTAAALTRITCTIDFTGAGVDPSTGQPCDSATVHLPLTLAVSAQDGGGSYESLAEGSVSATIGSATVTAASPALQVTGAEAPLSAPDDVVVTPQADLGSGSSFPADPAEGDTYTRSDLTDSSGNAVTYTFHGGTWYPDRLVNGNFQYPLLATYRALWGSNPWPYVYINVDTGYNATRDHPGYVTGFDSQRFAWRSDERQTWNPGGSAGYFAEIQADHKTGRQPCGTYNQSDGNLYSEASCETGDYSIYQDIATVPGSIYRWSMNHSGSSSGTVAKLQIMIGAQGGTLTAQEATRMGSATHDADGNPVPVLDAAGNPRNNGVNSTLSPGDTNALGYVSTVIETPPTAKQFWPDSTGSWETYQGTYLVPEGQMITRLKFNSMGVTSQFAQSLIDDVDFQAAYPLYFDANGGVGNLPMNDDADSAPRADDDGVYQNYYRAGEQVKLSIAQKHDEDLGDWSSTELTRADCTFMGWSTEAHEPFETVAAAEAALATDYTIQARTKQHPDASGRYNVVYAVWAKDPGSLSVTKKVIGSGAPADAAYTFVLQDAAGNALPGISYTVDGGEPQTTGADGTFAIGADQTATFTSLDPTSYTILEGDALGASSTSWCATDATGATTSGTGTGAVAVSTGRNSSLVFTNSYVVDYPIGLEKYVASGDGSAVTLGTAVSFGFTMTGSAEDATGSSIPCPLPTNASPSTEPIANVPADYATTPAGSATFGTLTFEKAGTYRYTIVETEPAGGDWTADAAKGGSTHVLTITLADDPETGALGITSAVWDGTAATVDSATTTGATARFYNRYAPAPVISTDTPATSAAVPTVMPRTGDGSLRWFALLAAAISVCGAVLCVAALVGRRRAPISR